MRILLIGGAPDPLLAAASALDAEVVHGGAHTLRVRPPDTVVLVSADDEELRWVRREHPAQAVVVWLDRSSTARAAELLELGADEALDPTMGVRELAARLRRAAHGSGRAEVVVELGSLRVDAAGGQATWAGSDLPLTNRERQVLQALAEVAGSSIRREVLYRRVWGFAMARGDRVVDVNVKRLRDKLAAAGAQLEITTVAGVGYRLDLSPDRNEAVTAL